MEHLAKIVIGVSILAFLGFLALIGIVVMLFAGLDSEPQNFSHEVEYSVDLTSNGTLNDTVLRTPFPESQEFETAVETENASTYVNDMNASLEVQNSSRGQVLEIDIGDFKPETRNETIEREFENSSEDLREDYIERTRSNGSEFHDYNSYDIIITVDYNRTLDTKNGLENEPHLFSTPTECEAPHATDCASTQAFTSYNADNSTAVDIEVDIEGRNTWNEGFSWRGNSYRQDFYTGYFDDEKLMGSQNSWVNLTGIEDEGDGVYLD